MMYNEANFIQLKMTSGDEIICEVMEWPMGESKDMIIRNAMSLSFQWDDTGDQIYGLKPWFTMIENHEEYIVINSTHILGTSKPNNSFRREYVEAVDEMHNIAKKREKTLERKTMADEQSFLDALEKLTQGMADRDSDKDNVIQFPDKPSIH